MSGFPEAKGIGTLESTDDSLVITDPSGPITNASAAAAIAIALSAAEAYARLNPTAVIGTAMA